MARVRAVLLAAGRGLRMGGESPKTLLPVGTRAPLAHYILRGLERCGISDLLVVTGFRSRALQDYLDGAWPHETTFVFNARYASWGNFHSLRVALDQSPGMDVVVVNSDVVVDPEAMRRVIASDGDLVLAIQQRRDLEAEDMRAQLRGDRVVAIGKDLRIEDSHGEFCGVSLIRPPAARLYLERATDSEWRAHTDIYYEDIYASVLPFIEARAAAVEDGEYAEVDSPEDLAAAGAVIDGHAGSWEPAAAAGEGP